MCNPKLVAGSVCQFDVLPAFEGFQYLKHELANSRQIFRPELGEKPNYLKSADNLFMS
jgi:hypothetical protein